MNKKKTAIDSESTIEQLKIENEIKTKWLSLIAHDFKGLFTNIQLLLDTYANKSISQEMFMTMLPELKQIAEKNSKTLESTFAWVNSQAAGFNHQAENVCVYELFSEIKDEFGEEISLKELSLDFVGDKKLSFASDRFLLKFILKQLVENGIKYSYKKGAVEVIAQLDAPMKQINITVKDNGVGMKHGILHNIGTLEVSPYTGTMEEKGAGLSLVIVKDFVEKLQGQMSISSVLNEGTSVRLTFEYTNKINNISTSNKTG